MKMEQSVPKRRHITFRHWGITPKESIQHSEQGESLKSRISKSDSRLEDIIFGSFFLEVLRVRNIVQNIGFIIRVLSLPEY
jgi:hypothetical protein